MPTFAVIMTENIEFDAILTPDSWLLTSRSCTQRLATSQSLC
jgi:hypothetical protein